MTTDHARPIAATTAAKNTLQRLRAEHGDLILHVTGGCCDARTPMCLKASDLHIGARDVLLGVVEGTPVYEMPGTPQATGEACQRTGSFLLDVVPGLPVGFSLDAGDGMRFAIRETVTSAAS